MLSVASLAFPANTSLADQAATIIRHGFTRLDPRATADGEVDPLATASRLAEIRHILTDAGVTSGCLYGYPGDADHLRRLMSVADAIGADMVRVLAGPACDIDNFITMVSAALGQPTDRGPMLVIQNHRTSSLTLAESLRVVQTINHPRLRLASSPDHELISGTWTSALLAAVVPWTGIWFLQDYIIAADGRWSPCLPGAGAIPWAEIVAANDSSAMRVSCKWEHRWHPEIPGPDIALPIYSSYLRRFNRY